MKTYQDINKETIDRWVEEGWEWGKPVSHEIHQCKKRRMESVSYSDRICST